MHEVRAWRRGAVLAALAALGAALVLALARPDLARPLLHRYVVWTYAVRAAATPHASRELATYSAFAAAQSSVSRHNTSHALFVFLLPELRQRAAHVADVFAVRAGTLVARACRGAVCGEVVQVGDVPAAAPPPPPPPLLLLHGGLFVAGSPAALRAFASDVAAWSGGGTVLVPQLPLSPETRWAGHAAAAAALCEWLLWSAGGRAALQRVVCVESGCAFVELLEPCLARGYRVLLVDPLLALVPVGALERALLRTDTTFDAALYAHAVLAACADDAAGCATARASLGAARCVLSLHAERSVFSAQARALAPGASVREVPEALRDWHLHAAGVPEFERVVRGALDALRSDAPCTLDVAAS